MTIHCIFSHGFESSPQAEKVTALANVAQTLGLTWEIPDYRALDARTDITPLGDVYGRTRQLVDLAQRASRQQPVVLVGSSLGAWISGAASMQVQVAGLFMMAPPVALDSQHPLLAAAVPIHMVHGWKDELIAADTVVEWARARSAQLLLVDDTHRLAAHVAACAQAFSDFIATLKMHK